MTVDPQLSTRQVDGLTRKISRVAIVTLCGAAAMLALITAMRPGGAANWERETGLFNYGSSQMTFLAALAAFLCFWTARSHHKSMTGGVQHPWIWAAAALTLLCAALDDGIGLHERLVPAFRDAHPWFKHLYFRKAGSDSTVMFALVMGAFIFTIFSLRELTPVRIARKLYLSALCTVFAAGMIEYLPPYILTDRLPTGSEELLDLVSSTLFCLAFGAYALDRTKLAVLNWLLADHSEKVEYSGPKCRSPRIKTR
jgi:hypothetical protein